MNKINVERPDCHQCGGKCKFPDKHWLTHKRSVFSVPIKSFMKGETIKKAILSLEHQSDNFMIKKDKEKSEITYSLTDINGLLSEYICLAPNEGRVIENFIDRLNRRKQSKEECLKECRPDKDSAVRICRHGNFWLAKHLQKGGKK